MELIEEAFLFLEIVAAEEEFDCGFCLVALEDDVTVKLLSFGTVLLELDAAVVLCCNKMIVR